MEVAGVRFTVVGAGRSGLAASNALASRGGDVRLVEARADATRPETLDARVTFVAGTNLPRPGDVAVLSPGVPEVSPVRAEIAAVAAEVIGVNLTIYKTLAFAVSAFYAGIAGGLFGFVLGFFDPFTFNMILSIIFLVMVVVGGLGTILGGIMGATLITYLQYDLLKNIAEVPYFGALMVAVSKQWFTLVGLENFSSMAIGLIMIGIIIFEPLGMFGVWIRMKKYWMTWPF